MATQISPSDEQRQRVHECREALAAAQKLCERLEMMGDVPALMEEARSIRLHLEHQLREALRPFAEQPV